jgi:mannose-6-phosphate isomerase-like protein (cupin superfamily)
MIGLALALAAAGATPAEVAAPADIKAAVAAMEREMKPGQTFAWRPLLRGGGAVAALEIWKAPGKPAIHPSEAEYATVVEGAGSLESGGTMVEPAATPSGMIEGKAIAGGSRRALKPGDVFLVPAGVAHAFGVEGGRLVLLGIKVPAGR